MKSRPLEKSKNGKLQITPLKFGGVWILHLEISKLGFYPLKFNWGCLDLKMSTRKCTNILVMCLKTNGL